MASFIFYFRNEARYRAENMQTDIFLKPLAVDQDKDSKGSLVLHFFCDVTCNPRIGHFRYIKYSA